MTPVARDKSFNEEIIKTTHTPSLNSSGRMAYNSWMFELINKTIRTLPED